MRDLFVAYYQPTGEQFGTLWDKALIVLDTNVLLDLYRLPTSTRDEFLTVLSTLKDRLWIPHQVALEFQRRRITVINAERKSIQNGLEKAVGYFGDLKGIIAGLELEKRGLQEKGSSLESGLIAMEEQVAKLFDEILAKQLNSFSEDPIRDSLDELYKGGVGDGPVSQDVLDGVFEEGEGRFENLIPPGFLDAAKDRNPKEANFLHGQLKYKSKFGDLLLWKQMIDHVRSGDRKHLIFVTEDKKEDWWRRESGKTIGPHPELINEMRISGGVELFWIYSSLQFVEHANKYFHAGVSSEAVREISQVSVDEVDSGGYAGIHKSLINFYSDIEDDDYEFIRTKSHSAFMMKHWLEMEVGTIGVDLKNDEIFLARRFDGVYAFEFKVVLRLNVSDILSICRSAFNDAADRIRTGFFSGYVLILIFDKINFMSLLHGRQGDRFIERLQDVMVSYGCKSIIFGFVERGMFVRYGGIGDDVISEVKRMAM
ncbi:hypothetical protein EC845_1972 [Comamonas sp. BIGb0124]|uniref:PIN-like domain-containing protein n=1 Tax=Comamonas sp. BIGb0124 TaxID=2485130 RepID=UPI000FA27CFB|nr:PIN-like domain-containing protein [Comamonas sp. BIGb0124]ROR23058.1 hypothetical protein EC845_1972 [Comamonas sp. BIGb0124]